MSKYEEAVKEIEKLKSIRYWVNDRGTIFKQKNNTHSIEINSSFDIETKKFIKQCLLDWNFNTFVKERLTKIINEKINTYKHNAKAEAAEILNYVEEEQNK